MKKRGGKGMVTVDGHGHGSRRGGVDRAGTTWQVRRAVWRHCLGLSGRGVSTRPKERRKKRETGFIGPSLIVGAWVRLHDGPP